LFGRSQLLGPQHINGRVRSSTLPRTARGNVLGRKGTGRRRRGCCRIQWKSLFSCGIARCLLLGVVFVLDPLLQSRYGMHMSKSGPRRSIRNRVLGMKTNHSQPSFGLRRHHTGFQQGKYRTGPIGKRISTHPWDRPDQPVTFDTWPATYHASRARAVVINRRVVNWRRMK